MTEKTNGAIFTIVQQLYHQRQGKEPTEHTTRIDKPLLRSEQPYTREMSSSKEQEHLDTGWIVNPSSVLITNLIHPGVRYASSPEKIIKANFEDTLEVFLGSNECFLKVIPGDTLRIECSDFSKVTLRSSNILPYSITVYSE